MPLSNKWNNRFLKLAREISTYSKDPSTKVGCVIANQDKTIISSGFNGFCKHMKDDKELYEDRETKYSRIIHAELNAIIHAKTSLEECICYTYPLPPCDRCVVCLLQAGITQFIAQIPDSNSLNRWKESIDRATKYIEEAGCRWIFLYGEIEENREED